MLRMLENLASVSQKCNFRAQPIYRSHHQQSTIVTAEPLSWDKKLWDVFGFRRKVFKAEESSPSLAPMPSKMSQEKEVSDESPPPPYECKEILDGETSM